MPKTQEFSFVVPGAPAQVAERIKAERRFRLFPFQGTVLIPKDRPLAGRVNAERFALALNERDWLTLMQAVAKGQLTEAPEGTRISGVAGMPGWVTWMLRFTTVLSVFILGFGALTVASAGGGALGAAALFFGCVMFAVVLGVGLNVKNADEQVPALVTRLEAAARGPTLTPQGVAAAEPEVARRRRAQAASRQRQG